MSKNYTDEEITQIKMDAAPEFERKLAACYARWFTLNQEFLATQKRLAMAVEALELMSGKDKMLRDTMASVAREALKAMGEV